MASPQNQAAWLVKAGEPLKVDAAPLPIPGPNEIVIRTRAVAINPLDTHMQDHGVFVQQYPAILGCDVAGEVFQVGPGAEKRFKKDDRVIGHVINLVSGRPEDGAFALYTILKADKAAVLPDTIAFTDGVVVPFALEAAVCALCVKEPGVAMPGVATPALALPYPSANGDKPSAKKTLVVYGGSSSSGSMVTQLAAASGITVLSVVGARNVEFSKRAGASQAFDRSDADLVKKLVQAAKTYEGHQFIGIFDAISTPETFAHDSELLAQLGGTHLAAVHPPPPAEQLPAGVRAGMIFAVNGVAGPVWEGFVTTALESGRILCLPKPTVVGKGLEFVDEALKKYKAGVSATKLVVEL